MSFDRPDFVAELRIFEVLHLSENLEKYSKTKSRISGSFVSFIIISTPELESSPSHNPKKYGSIISLNLLLNSSPGDFNP